MEYKRFENTVFARIDKGEEIVETLKTICEKEDITLAYVNAIGAVGTLPSACLKRRKSSMIPTVFRLILRSSRSRAR